MSPTSPRVIFNNRPRFILDLNERSDAAVEPRSGARGSRAIGPSRTRCTRRSKRPSPAVAGPMRHVDFETEPRLERIFAQMRPERRAGAPPTRWKGPAGGAPFSRGRGLLHR